MASVQDLLPLEDIVDGVLCLRGGDYRAVLEAQSVNFSLRSDEEQEGIMAGYRAFLNALSYPIQVLVRILPTDVETYLAALRERLGGRGAETLPRLALDHEAFVRRLARERTLLERRFYVVVPAGLDGAFERRAVRWPWQGNEAKAARQGFEAARRQLTFRSQEIAQGLVNFGVPARRLGSEELAQLWYAFLAAELARPRKTTFASRPAVVSEKTTRKEVPLGL
ncbi:MAG: hypothetical protein Q8P22_13550 [Chloroflexota bacterium]|nr:hypothetical protein [Chloroflexota bacterium]